LSFYDIKYNRIIVNIRGAKMKEEELIKLEKKLWESADKMRGAVPVSDLNL